jgi:hypothetical protein
MIGIGAAAFEAYVLELERANRNSYNASAAPCRMSLLLLPIERRHKASSRILMTLWRQLPA